MLSLLSTPSPLLTSRTPPSSPLAPIVAELIHSRHELDDLRTCLTNYKARSYFRLFLSREFNVENIAFWEAVQEYKVLFKKRAKFIYTTYVSQAAVSQVNIPAAQRARIKGSLTGDEVTCDAQMYDLAQEEIYHLMARDPFPRFLKSDLAVTYAKIARENDKIAQRLAKQGQQQYDEEKSTVETEPPPSSAWEGGAAGRPRGGLCPSRRLAGDDQEEG